jgi:enolase-phosphatase E1
LESLPLYVSQHWEDSEGEFFDIKSQFPSEAMESSSAFVAHCKYLNAKNLKFPPWKTLQGLLWRKLYDDGTVKAPLYDDVYPVLHKLKESGIRIYIYSSGSIEAQKLLFQHTNHGDIRSIIDGCI